MPEVVIYAKGVVILNNNMYNNYIIRSESSMEYEKRRK